MSIEITDTQAQKNFVKLLDDVTEDREIVIIRRQGGEDAALIAASELSSLMETAYLLRSPANAERLLAALGRALKREGEALTLDELRKETDLNGQSA
jgi:antitoxin YefM